MNITATYSVEDNKLRLYPTERLPQDLYEKVKIHGFKWAPIQKLFVAPMWTPNREDLCIELAGEITAEETTLAERAEAKAQRLDAMIERKKDLSNSFYEAANQIGQRFASGQPILVGHHSERRARKDQERMHKAAEKSVQLSKSIRYWQWKANGVERYADYKNNPVCRQNRIETLLKDLRTRQRHINHAKICVRLWERISKLKESKPEKYVATVEHYAGSQLNTGPAGVRYHDGSSIWSKLRNKEIDSDEAVAICLEHFDGQAKSQYIQRWISHILNRLAYETAMLGPVLRYTGEMTAAILQTFARAQGAHKPKATFSDGVWTLESSVDLPFHISSQPFLSLTSGEWSDLMQASGYEVPAKKESPPPILNFKAETIISKPYYGNNEVIPYRQIEMTKAQHKALWKDHKWIRVSNCRQFRFKVCKHPEQSGYKAEWCAVFITDSKVHPTPQTESVILSTDNQSSYLQTVSQS